MLIHIPKTGGTFLRKGVWGGNYEGPEFGAVPGRWKHEFKFAFVRHPLCRLTSAYRMFTEGAVGDPSWKLAEDARPLSFDAFLDIVLDESIIFDQRRRTFEEKIRHHTICILPRKFYLCSTLLSGGIANYFHKFRCFVVRPEQPVQAAVT